MEQDILAVDLSHHNVLINSGVKHTNLVGVIHKATEGSTLIDGNYADRRAKVKKLGLKWSSYHYLHHGDVEDQMRFYLANSAPEPGDRVCIDYEHDDVVLDDLHRAVNWILDADPSLQITVYAGHLIKEQLGSGRDALLADNTSLWIAHYTSASEPTWPEGTWPVWTLWQYTDGSVGGNPKGIEGIEGTYDCNAFNGDRDACIAWFGGEEEAVSEDEVVIDLKVPTDINVTIRINGVEVA